MRSLGNITEIISKRILNATLWKVEGVTKYLFSKKYTVIKKENLIFSTENSELYQRLIENKVKKIKLIGDSITAGVGVWTYHTQKGTNLIFSDNENYHYEASHLIHSWGNFFRMYIKENFPLVLFENYGIPGVSAKWVNKFKNKVISNEEDVVIVMLGTNDRWDCHSTLEFEQELESLLSYINQRSKLMYVFAPPPVANNENQLNFGMKEVNEITKKVCNINNYAYFSHFDNMMDYSMKNNIPLHKMFERHGSHPIESGYIKMWYFIKEKLTLK